MYVYAHDSIFLKEARYTKDDTLRTLYSKAADSNTIAALERIAGRFLDKGKKQFYYNNCIDDGFSFKIYIRRNTKTSKIIVSNFYDPLADSLTRIFDQQLKDYKPGFVTEIGYGDDPAAIEQIIKSQQHCPDKLPASYRKFLMNTWCEWKER